MAAAVVVQAPQLLSHPDPTQGRGIRVMLTAWALQLDTKTPEHPGAIIDYIAAYLAVSSKRRSVRSRDRIWVSPK